MTGKFPDTSRDTRAFHQNEQAARPLDAVDEDDSASDQRQRERTERLLREVCILRVRARFYASQPNTVPSASRDNVSEPSGNILRRGMLRAYTLRLYAWR